MRGRLPRIRDIFSQKSAKRRKTGDEFGTADSRPTAAESQVFSRNIRVCVRCKRFNADFTGEVIRFNCVEFENFYTHGGWFDS